MYGDQDTQIRILIEELGSDDMDRRWQAAERLRSMGTEVIEPLLEVVYTNTGTKSWEAVQILGHFQDPRLIEPLTQALKSSHPLMSTSAAKALERFGESTLPLLLESLPHCILMTQLLIVGIMERGKFTPAIDPLLKLLLETPESTLRYTIIQALGTLSLPGEKEIIEAIRSFEDDPDHHVRKRVRIALSRLDPTFTEPPSTESD